MSDDGGGGEPIRLVSERSGGWTDGRMEGSGLRCTVYTAVLMQDDKEKGSEDRCGGHESLADSLVEEVACELREGSSLNPSLMVPQ